MDLDKEPSIYMRFHVTLEKAIGFCRHLYGDELLPYSEIPLFKLALIIAGLTEDIDEQDYLDYHLTWLTGVLSGTLSFKPYVYEDEIDNILGQLQDVESNRIKEYIRLLTLDRRLPLGQQYLEVLGHIKEMDCIPCYIMIFRLYQACESIKEGRLQMEHKEGFFAYAYLFWWSSIYRHMNIGKNIKGYIRDFFKQLEKEVGGVSQARTKAQEFYKQL